MSHAPAAQPPLTSPLFQSQLPRLRECAARGPLIDLACGQGRHALALADEGIPCIGLDRDRDTLHALRERAADLPLHLACADLETEHGLPLPPGRASAILVFRFLYRPLAPAIVDALAPGGCLIYETFTLAQAELEHGPKREAFLLHPGELGRLFPGLLVLEYEEGLFPDGKRDSHLARLVAVKPER